MGESGSTSGKSGISKFNASARTCALETNFSWVLTRVWNAASRSAKTSPDFTYASLFRRSCSRMCYMLTPRSRERYLVTSDDVSFDTSKVLCDNGAKLFL